MRPNFETAEIRCYSNTEHFRNNCIRMGSTRGDVMQKGSGFESKGLVLLLICGLYAVFLFVIARIFSCITSRITTSVKSVVWRVETRERLVAKTTDNNNNNSALKPKPKFKRLQPRTISHG